MEELYEILEDIIPGEDYKNSTALVDDDILTSFELVRLVTEIDSTFDMDTARMAAVRYFPDFLIVKDFLSFVY